MNECSNTLNGKLDCDNKYNALKANASLLCLWIGCLVHHILRAAGSLTATTTTVSPAAQKMKLYAIPAGTEA